MIRVLYIIWDAFLMPKKKSCLLVAYQEPVEIMGVIAYPDEDRTIHFIDSGYSELFTIPDGGNIVITTATGEKMVQPCRYIDYYHTSIGGDVYHICQFAEWIERIGAKCAPEVPEITEKTPKPQKHKPKKERGEER